jgi:hypothetical protein
VKGAKTELSKKELQEILEEIHAEKVKAGKKNIAELLT